jgi:hypothetical protein
VTIPEQQPQFATNRHDWAMTVAGEVNKLFRVPRQKFAQTPPIAIATAYINPAGFALLADELEASPRVRMLIGAEPEEDSVRAITAGIPTKMLAATLRSPTTKSGWSLNATPWGSHGSPPHRRSG